MHRISALRSLIAGVPLASPSRTLYSASSLGMDNYLGTRARVQTYLVDNGDKFRSKMTEFVDGDNSRNMIFTEDLKNMVHIVEPNDSDIELTIKMIKKFNAQNKEVRFGNFIFGPIVMRMFHHLGDEQRALDCFNAPELAGFFDQLSAYHILVDMLYEKGRYADVRTVFETIKGRQIQGGMYPKHVLVLVFAACYKENTAASFAYSSALWTELQQVGHVPMRKATTFAAALALAQNAPHVALEIVSNVRQQGYMTVRNIKALALAQLGRPDDVLPILRSVLDATPMGGADDAAAGQYRKQTFSRAVLDGVRQQIAERSADDRELQQTFAKLEQVLIDQGHVTDDTLDDWLCAEIATTAHNGQRRDRSVLAASYYGNGQQNGGRRDRQWANNDGRNRSYQRPGLNDLY